MTLIADSYSSQVRPVLRGVVGAVSAAHPLAVSAAQQMLVAGGSAADAVVAAQAVLCVVAPDACGLGGDMFALVKAHDGMAFAINAAGSAPLAARDLGADGPNSITVPGIVAGWASLSAHWGRLALSQTLAPAVAVARKGFVVPERLAATVRAQDERLRRGGGEAWGLFAAKSGQVFVQNALADLLTAIGEQGQAAFYRGRFAAAITSTVQGLGGTLSLEDLQAHETLCVRPITTCWKSARIAVQPPMAQGVLLSMALAGLASLGDLAADRRDHAMIELTEAAFAYRHRVGEGKALLDLPLEIDLERAAGRGGPRAYLHTAGVAVTDADGLTLSSLVSVFDDFGSCVFVPACGITLNNRAGGFTQAPNLAGPGRRPVHTLAPILLELEAGTLALATPGADGQVQTLLQIVSAVVQEGLDLAQAIAKPRWRSEGGELLIEARHPQIQRLRGLGHRIKVLPDGDTRFGAVVCAGNLNGQPVAVADWRRDTWAGAV